MNVFLFDDYKKIIEQSIEENRDKIRAYRSKLADAAGCKQSFLSQVLHGASHITMDHAWGINQFWQLKNLESDYFLCLVQYARASSLAYRAELQKKLQQLKNQSQKISSRLKNPTSLETSLQQASYYQHWAYSAVHLALTIPKLQNPKAMAEYLGLPSKKVLDILKQLCEMEIVGFDASKNVWRCLNTDMHLPQDSPLAAIYHQQWRLRTFEQFSNLSPSKVHYTAIQSMSQKTYAQIHELFLNLIQNSREAVQNSPEEELVCTTIDFYKLN